MLRDVGLVVLGVLVAAGVTLLCLTGGLALPWLVVVAMVGGLLAFGLLARGLWGGPLW